MKIDRRKFLSHGLAATASSTFLSGENVLGGLNSVFEEKEAMENRRAIDRFRSVPRLNLVNLSTLIERCDRLRKEIPGAPHLYIKRDDCLGYLVGGNKLRKLEFVMAEALRQKATTVLTVGSIQSNHARVTAMVAKRLGLNCALILNGEVSGEPRANFRINRLLGVKVETVETRAQRNEAMNAMAADLEKKGERVYKVPLGASDEVGSFGFVKAMEEVNTQAKEMGVKFDAIIFSSSSGGTQAGLEVGRRLFGLDHLHVIGVSPDDPSESVKASIVKAMKPMLSRLGLPADIGPAKLSVDDKYFGEGYRIPTDQSLEATDLFTKTEGILLDPVYTSKAAAALIDYCRKQRFRPTDHVLFWHTGGLMTLFE
jgi:D-cysteine desulfhydrase family pyridoxal phosphate-dependent enzyme